MKRLLKVVIMVCVLTAVMNTVHTASWFGFGQKITQADRDLSVAITDGEYRAVNKALEAKANPNAKVDGHTTLFVHAFEEALERDENNKITAIDSDRSDIARYVAAAGGNIEDLNQELKHYVDAQGKPRISLFENAQAARDFEMFVNNLKHLVPTKKR